MVRRDCRLSNSPGILLISRHDERASHQSNATLGEDGSREAPA